jgi:hypothetical protein
MLNNKMSDISNTILLFLAVVWCVILPSCTTSPPRKSSHPGFIFEVRFAHESAQGLRVGGPVLIGSSRVGNIRRVEHKFEHSLGETRTYALIQMAAGSDLRVEDRISIRFDEAAKENYIEISMKEGDRSQWRPIERGMLMEGDAGSTFSEKVKGASSSFSEKIKDGYHNLKKKVQGK